METKATKNRKKSSTKRKATTEKPVGLTGLFDVFKDKIHETAIWE